MAVLPALQPVAPPYEPAPVGVELIDGSLLLASAPAPAPAPEPTPMPPAPPKPVEKVEPAQPVVRRASVRPAQEAAAVEPKPAGGAPKGDPSAQLSEGELAMATTAHSGPAGRACNMVGLLQTSLRKDAKVQAAVAEAHRAGGFNKAILLWRGDWVRTNEEEGAGLAGVRETMMLGIAFAPEACRSEPMRGVVLISLNDAPGAPRLALGSAAWRWTDLLTPRQGG